MKLYRRVTLAFLLALLASPLALGQLGAGTALGSNSGLDVQSGIGTSSSSDCLSNPNSAGCSSGIYSGGGDIDSKGVSSVDSVTGRNLGLNRLDQREASSSSETESLNSLRTPSPEPPTEFQRFVNEAIGERLPIYGNQLFQNVPSTFAPVDHVPVSPDYIIGPGDELRIRVWGQINFELLTNVDRSGQIYFPKVGPITVVGVKYGDLVPTLKAAVGKIFKNFDLSANMGHLRTIQVFVVGQARRPGSYSISSLSTLVNALFASGGPTPQGSLRNIQLKRNDKVVTEFDLYDLLLKGDKSKDVPLQSGDVIYIPPVGPVVAMTGSVNIPAIYELKGRTTLSDALSLVGGLDTVADGEKAMVERIDEHRARKIEEFPLDQSGLSRELKDGDVVQIISIVPKFENAVTIRGNVANPGRYVWHEGMKLRELIPNREFLLTREFWRNQNQLGAPPRRVEQTPGWDGQKQLRTSQVRQQTALTQAPIAANQTTEGSLSATGNLPRTGASESLGAVVAAAGAQPVNQPGEALRESTSSSTPSAKALTIDVKRSAPDINWDYAVIQRLNTNDLSTQLIPFNLGRLVLAGDESQNMELKPGDVVTIFSQRDLGVPIERRTKFVRLEGEVRSPGVYKVESGDTLRTLVSRAGGLSSNAYLYGSDFTRESLRVEQQRGLDETVRSMEVALAAQGESGNLLVDKLRQLRASGRIVLEVHPADKEMSNLPPLTLEDGDRLVIPSKPSTINVVGAVYNQSSFMYRRGKRVGDYLRLAGQGTREADRKHMFLIRADGSIVSKATHNGLWSSGFDSLRVLPGDTVVVPMRVIRANRLRTIQNWSSLFSQFAIGAAGLAVILP